MKKTHIFNIFSTIANRPYSPPVNTDIDYYWTFFVIVQNFSYFFFGRHAFSDAVLFEGRKEASACLIMLRAKQGGHWYYF